MVVGIRTSVRYLSVRTETLQRSGEFVRVDVGDEFSELWFAVLCGVLYKCSTFEAIRPEVFASVLYDVCTPRPSGICWLLSRLLTRPGLDC
jgi:hypothetical protein